MQLDDIGFDNDDSRMRHPSSARLGFPTRNDEAVKASLAAVRAAREAARVRSRRQGWTARLTALAVFGGAATGWAVLRSHDRKVGAVAQVAKASATATTPTLENAAHVNAAIQGSPVVAQAAPALSAEAAPVEAAEGAADTEACDKSFAAHQWKIAVEQCQSAFAAAPSRADLALKVAKAQHARAHYQESLAWAETTVKLAPDSAEAFAIIARSERRAGHANEAAAAYRRYLSLAPRGWHAHEARMALRGASAQHEAAPAVDGQPTTVSQAD